MSIFGIIGFSCLIGILVYAIGVLTVVIINDYEDTIFIVTIILTVITIILGVVAGIALTTSDEKIYVAKYEAQKTTIEQSLKSDMLGDFERIELVNEATELNGELAERKAKFELWHHVHFDNHIYDNVEFIEFGGRDNGN